MREAMDWFISQYGGTWPTSAVQDLEHRLLGILNDPSNTTVEVMEEIAKWIEQNETGQPVVEATVMPMVRAAAGR